MRPVVNVAHRGASGHFPENTLPAFEAAIAAGAAMCELDPQRTRDGAIVVIHDSTVDRTTDGRGKVAAMTLAQLRGLDAGSWRDSSFAGTRIPTLAEALDFAHGCCGLNLELKAPGLEAELCHIVHDRQMDGRVLVSSFDWKAVANVRRVAPHLRAGLLANRGAARMIDAAVNLGAAAINPEVSMITERLCTEAHQRNLTVYAWTVDDASEMRRLIELGVDGIMTNYPERLRAILDG
jgi:glycerophosphoryl diester phosphodiesterase